jgi:hypothetical protein
MCGDNISLIAQSDPLIVAFGLKLYSNHRDDYQNKYVITRMRDMAKLMALMRERNENIELFEQCLTPVLFDDLMECVRVMSGFDPETGTVKKPSVAPRMCPSLKTCSDILRCNVVKDPLLVTPQKVSKSKVIDDFLYLMKSEWQFEIGSNAEKSRRKAKVVKPDILPDSDDITMAFNQLSNRCNESIDKLKKYPSHKHYNDLAKICIAQIIILNRRRPGEVTRALLDQYLKKEDNTIPDNWNLSNLTQSQKDNAHNMDLFYIAGKGTQKVPCILTKTMREGIDALVASRNLLKIDSHYLFPKPGVDTLSCCYDGTIIIDELRSSFRGQMKKPSDFTATGLRHHAATMSQLLGADIYLFIYLHASKQFHNQLY